MKQMLPLIVGPFIGAFAAFLSNRLLDAGRRHREQLVAANLALLTLKNQYNDYLLFRKGFRIDVARPGIIGDEPLWVLIRPSFINFGGYELDYKSLGFLFEHSGNRAVLDKVELSQICYRDLVAISKLRTESAVSVQKSVVNYLKENPKASWDSIADVVGADTTAMMSMIAVGLAIRAERDEGVYLDAFHALHDELEACLRSYWFERFKKFICQCEKVKKSRLIELKPPKKSFDISELPAMPKNLVIALEKVPIPNDLEV